VVGNEGKETVEKWAREKKKLKKIEKKLTDKNQTRTVIPVLEYFHV
jgi:hypothetical protein